MSNKVARDGEIKAGTEWRTLCPLVGMACACGGAAHGVVDAKTLWLDEVVAGHFGGLGDAHDVEDGGGNVGEDAVGHGGVLVGGHVNTGHGVERVGCVGGAVGVDGVVGVAVVSDDDDFIVGGFGCFNGVFHAVVNSFHGLLNGFVDAGVANHVAVGEVHYDEVVFLAADCLNEFVFHFVGAHFGLEVVGGNFG